MALLVPGRKIGPPKGWSSNGQERIVNCPHCGAVFDVPYTKWSMLLYSHHASDTYSEHEETVLKYIRDPVYGLVGVLYDAGGVIADCPSCGRSVRVTTRQNFVKNDPTRGCLLRECRPINAARAVNML